MTTPRDGHDDDRGGARTRAPGPPSMSAARRWTYRLLAMTLVPAVVLVGIELGLRLVGVGRSTSFFVPSPSGEAWITNPRYGWLYFPPSLARAPLADTIERTKPDGTYRVFVLGASAAARTTSSTRAPRQ